MVQHPALVPGELGSSTREREQAVPLCVLSSGKQEKNWYSIAMQLYKHKAIFKKAIFIIIKMVDIVMLDGHQIYFTFHNKGLYEAKSIQMGVSHLLKVKLGSQNMKKLEKPCPWELWNYTAYVLYWAQNSSHRI